MIYARFTLVVLIAVSALCGCRGVEGVDDKVEMSLNIAAGNRAELEAVLKHYENDSLRLAAAKFLIANMPGHYSHSNPTLLKRYHNAADSFMTANEDMAYAQLCDSIKAIHDKMGIGNVPRESDCRLLPARYLIDNIDAAFGQWENNPWLRHLDFDDFCEYILPYKVMELQPLDNWREDFSGNYADLLDQLRYCDLYDGSAYRACKTLTDAYKRDRNARINNQRVMPVYDVAVRLKEPWGPCSDFVYATAVVFRSVGLPVAMDCTPHWANIRLGHSWNVLLAQNGRTVPFVGMLDRMENGMIMDERPPKVFRHTYAPSASLMELNRSGEYVPHFFRDPFMKDVTDEYIATSTVEVDCNDGAGHRYAYLCVYGDNDWTPVDVARVEHGNAVFNHVARNVVYLPVTYSETGTMEPLCDPFLLGHDGNIHRFSGNGSTVPARLYRKSPSLRYTWDYAKLAKGGEFEASNDPSFNREVYNIHTIPSGYAIAGEAIIPDSVGAFRYWRYIHRGEETYCSMADIFFYGSDNPDKPLGGKIIGTEGSWENDPQWSRENLFDGDPLTSYCAPEHTGCWVGLDMGQPVKVSKLRYVPRGDGNMIEVGDRYELYYWCDGKWKSLGRKKASTVFLEYDNIPSNSLLLLRDITKGQEERVFSLADDGKQVWR